MRGLLDNGYILTQLVNKEWVIDEFDELQYDNKTIEHKKIGKWEHIQRGKIEGEVRRGLEGACMLPVCQLGISPSTPP